MKTASSTKIYALVAFLQLGPLIIYGNSQTFPSWFAAVKGKPTMVVRGKILKVGDEKTGIVRRSNGEEVLVQNLYPIEIEISKGVIYSNDCFNFSEFDLIRRIKSNDSVIMDSAFLKGGKHEKLPIFTVDAKATMGREVVLVISSLVVPGFRGFLLEGLPTDDEVEKLIKPLKK